MTEQQTNANTLATRARVKSWLIALGARLPSGTKPDDLDAWAVDLAQDVDLSAFTDRARRTMAIQFSPYFPAYGELVKGLREFSLNRQREKQQREGTPLQPDNIRRVDPYKLRDDWMRDHSSWLDQVCPLHSDEPSSLRWWIGDDILTKAMKGLPLRYSDDELASRARWLVANPIPNSHRSVFQSIVQRSRAAASDSSADPPLPADGDGEPVAEHNRSATEQRSWAERFVEGDDEG